MTRRARRAPTREPDANAQASEPRWTLRYVCQHGHGELGRLEFGEVGVHARGGFQLDRLRERWENLDAPGVASTAPGALPGRYRLTCERCARGRIRTLDLQLALEGLGARVQEAWLRAEPTAVGVRVVVV